jgi:hypothetical protein
MDNRLARARKEADNVPLAATGGHALSTRETTALAPHGNQMATANSLKVLAIGGDAAQSRIT